MIEATLEPSNIHERNKMVEQVIKDFSESETFGEAMTRVLKNLIQPKELEDELGRKLFASEMWGNLNGAEE